MTTTPQPATPPPASSVAGEIRGEIQEAVDAIAAVVWPEEMSAKKETRLARAAIRLTGVLDRLIPLTTAAEKVEALVAENERLAKELALEKQINLNACRDAADDDTAIKALFSPFGIASDHPPVEGDDGRFKSSVEVCEEAAGMMGELTKERNHLSKEMMQKCQDYVAIDELCKELTAKVAELEGAFRYFFAVYDCLTENGKFGWRPYCIGKDVIDGMRNAMNGEPPPSVPGEVVDRSAFEGEEYERKRSAMAKEELEKSKKPRETYDQAAWLNNMANDYDED